jgi:tetraacyldisaccharide 4'-kinase
MDEAAWRELISGQRTGWSAGLARLGLGLLSGPYALAIHLRNLGYRLGLFPSRRVSRPVISIGNLTVGGTGKTPIVAWVCQRLLDHGIKPAILSRGYGRPSLTEERSSPAAQAATNSAADATSESADAKGAEPAVMAFNDEGRMLAELLPGVPQRQGRDRVALAESYADDPSVGAFVLDDGFQHRRLRRDLDLVLIDATCPFGYDALLPAGLLREPLGGLTRAGAVIVTRADRVSADTRAEIVRRIRCHAPAIPIAVVSFPPMDLIDPSGAAHSLEMLTGRAVVAACGIGHPEPFFQTLRDLGADPRVRRSFPDHHGYTSADVQSLLAAAEELHRARGSSEPSGSRMVAEPAPTPVIVTHKDLVKLKQLPGASGRFLALRIGVRFESGEAELERALLAAASANAD